MTYIPHTDKDRQEMLAALGVASIEELFQDVPERLRFPELNLPPASTEMQIEREMADLADSNAHLRRQVCFLGAGVYDHYSPPTVDYVLRRGEFYTAYTPYQPEVSQGLLQTIFEYQSMICRLTGMDVCNASHYDGATALAEAVLLALNATRGDRTKVLLSPTLHPQYRQVIRTYLRGIDVSIAGEEDLGTETAHARSMIDRNTAALVIQNPNFFGQFEEVAGLADAVHEAGGLLIVMPDPISLGLFEPPGRYGADVVAAEGQSLGIPMSFGGPHLGVFATKRAQVRRLSGRLVGETVDAEGKRGYVLTLTTREQHIRREKATSNICTNAALTALGATVYLATMGKTGLSKVAELCYHKSHYAAGQIAKLNGLELNPQAPSRPFFKEFVIKVPRPVDEVNQILLHEFDLVGGYDLGHDYPHLDRHMLIAVTEKRTRDDIDRLVEGLRRATR